MAEYRKYKSVTRDQINQLRAMLASKGFQVPKQDKGDIKYKGFHIRIEFREAEKALYVMVDPPILLSANIAWKAIGESLVNPHDELQKNWA